MGQNQYQSEHDYNETPFSKKDPLMDYIESLPDPDIEVSRKVERDVEQFQTREKEDKQRKFRLRTFIAAAVIALTFNIGRFAFNAERNNTHDYNDYDYPVEVVEYEEGDGVLDDDLKEPEVLIDGDYYHFPFAISELLDKGWEVSESDSDVTVGPYEEFITLERGEETLHVVSVISPDGTSRPVEDALVTGFVTYDHDDPEVLLPHGIQPGVSTEDELVQAMRDAGLSWSVEEYEYEGEVTSKYYKYYAPVDNGSFTYYIVEITVDKDGTVTKTDLWLVDWSEPFGLEDAVNS